MPILHSPGVITPGQLGPISLTLGFSARKRFHLHHVEHGNTFGDGVDHANARLGSFHDRVSRERWRNENHRRIRARCLHRFVHSVEDGQAVGIFGAALAGRDAADHFGAVFQTLFGVKRPGRTGDALTDNLGFAVDENAHRAGRITDVGGKFE